MHINDISKIIAESISEIMAYHGTGADFDRFNHKKYLNSGYGSQCFGWGTYVSDDVVIAKSYADDENNKYSLEFDGDDITDMGVFMDSFRSKTNFNKNTIQDIYYAFSTNNYDINTVIKNYIISVKKGYKIYSELDKNDSAREYQFKWITEAERIINTLLDLRDDGRLVYTSKNRYLYKVEIPNDNGGNYLEWDERIPKEQMRRILLGFGSLNRKWIEMIQKNNYPFRCTFYGYIRHPKFREIVDIMVDSEDYSSFFASGFRTDEKTNIGGQVYRYLESLFGSDKAASLYLMNLCGFDGIKYETGTRWRKPDGASDDGHNYVIFDANKVKIIKKEKR